jgi:glycosyltransferase involved in cell wall biosynthesis
MQVLNVVPNPESRFFEQQVEALEAAGIEQTTVPVPGQRTQTNETTTTRSVTDYLRLHPAVFRRSFGEYDLIHANYGLTAPAALTQPRLPVVLSLWGSDLMGKYGRLSTLCAKHADAVIVMSDEMAALLDRECHVIPHGVDFDRFQPMPKQQARERVSWDTDGTHILFPYPKTRDVKDYPRAKQVVESARERLDSDPTLHTLTSVPHEQMPYYMNASDALLLTSKREGSPNSVKEALACNLPVVTTDVGDVRKRLDGVDPSFVCRSDADLVDGLCHVLRRGERSNGREAVRSLSLSRMATRIESVYRTVLETDTDSHTTANVAQR